MVFKDNYKNISGWIHDFYCDNDGSELIFDENNNSYFECPVCHTHYNDDKKKMAWTIKYRYKIFSLLETYSEKYLLDKKQIYLDFIEDALNYYALNYDKFIIHNKDGETFDNYVNNYNRCGKITAQGLNESMIMIQVVNCINNVKEYLKKETLNNIFNKLFPQVFKLLKPQVNKIHNIKCYEICAIAMMGIITNQKDMIDFAFDSPFSFYNQLDKGVTKDYFWFESSFHYHLFILKPILELLRLDMMSKHIIFPKYYDIVKRMVIQSYKCSFSDCSLPSPNDGWPNRNLIDYIKTYELSVQIFGDEFYNILDNIRNNKNDFKTVHCINTGFSILKNEKWNIFIKYQDQNYNHTHPDKLNIEIKCKDKFLTHDLSTSGYGSEICNRFYKKTYSHNTIVVNGVDQNLNCDSLIDCYDENKINVKINNVYKNVEVSRKIELISNNISDELEVDCFQNSNIDYFFHCDAQLTTQLDTIYIKKIKEYPYLKNIRKVKSQQDDITLEWNLKGKKIFSKINIKNKELYICDSPDNPNYKSRTSLLIRTINKNTLFKIEWTLS